DSCAGLCVLPTGRPCVSVLPLRIVLQHLRLDLCARAADVESVAAARLSVGAAVSCWFFRRAVQTGEIHLPLRPAAAADDSRQRVGVEAIRPRRQSLRDYGLPAGTGLHLLLREIHRLER